MDWATIATLATAVGTMVLAAATFASVRSANRAARTAERALLAQIRPVLVPSRFEDPMEKVGFMDDVWLKVPGGRAAAEATNDAVYLAIALRNVGSGIARAPLRPVGRNRGSISYKRPCGPNWVAALMIRCPNSLKKWLLLVDIPRLPGIVEPSAS
jgi:hypothetical protein